MLNDLYAVRIAPDFQTFEFVSVGPKGNITKVVSYTEINIKGFYNLGFGDKDPITGYLSDLSITNNGDSQKVLTTMAATLYAFTEKNIGSTIILTGSTQARTRLYQMGISNNLNAIEKDFLVLGLTNSAWEPFQKNIAYGAFLVTRKI